MATVFRTASTYLKLALIFMALGLLMFIIGFATAHWSDHPTWHRGLWAIGSYRRQGSYKVNDNSSYVQAIQAMECLGLIGFVLAFLAMLLYFVMDSARRRDFIKGACVLTLAGLVFSVIGYALAGSYDYKNNLYNHQMGWSFILAIIGSGFYGLAALMLILQLVGC